MSCRAIAPFANLQLTAEIEKISGKIFQVCPGNAGTEDALLSRYIGCCTENID
jgi:hypothetical protein